MKKMVALSPVLAQTRNTIFSVHGYQMKNLCGSSAFAIFLRPLVSLFNVLDGTSFLLSQLLFWIVYIPVRSLYNKHYAEEDESNSDAADRWVPNLDSLLLTFALYSALYYIFVLVVINGRWCTSPTVVEVAKEIGEIGEIGEMGEPLPQPDESLSISDFSSALQA
jgi:hypothetical protein